MTNWDGIKKGFTIFANARLALAAVGLLTVFTFPKTFQQRPVTLVIATVSRTVIHDDMVKMNLSIVIKCLTSQDRQCSHELWKVHWPSVGPLEVKMPVRLQDGVKGPVKLRNGDLQGRTYYQLELLTALQGTDTIVINTEINGRVVKEDLKLLDVRGLDMLKDQYKCRLGEVIADQVVSQVICEQEISMKDRLVALIPLMGG